MKNMSNGMGEYFRFSTNIKHFLFENLHISDTTGLVGACAVMFVLTILIEGTKSLVMYLQLRLKQHPLSYGQTDVSINQDRIRFHVGGYILHSFNILLGYVLMLAVMSYDAYICITVIAGSGLGYFIFGFVNTRNQAKFASLIVPPYDQYDSQTVLTDSDPPSGQDQG